jgi:lipid-A-disaccharide synthase-like uncharacterized protein
MDFFSKIPNVWLIIGFLGQFFFTMRFLVQWIYTEINKKSVIPRSFWILSILGSSLLLIYAIQRKDPVFILGQSFGFIVYGRNLYFVSKSRKNAEGKI